MRNNLIHIALFAIFLTLVICCTKADNHTPETNLSIRLHSGRLCTRSMDPEENKISDLNVFLFNSEGYLEYSKFISRREFVAAGDGTAEIQLRTILGQQCAVYVCANFGYEINGISSIEDLESSRYYLAYPDEYSKGIPMTGKWTGTVKSAGSAIDIGLVRMMSKISLRIDRSALSPGIKMNIRSVEIKQCPKSALLFGKSKAENATDVFQNGFIKTYAEADELNVEASEGVSREVSLYMLENMQGDILKGITSEKDKVLGDNSPEAGVCSYIEVKAEYFSDKLHTPSGGYLIYRFYLGESPENFDIERNCLYTFTIRPSGNGLDETSWRVDKKSLETKDSSGSIVIHPSDYIEGSVGDDIHVRAEIVGDTVDFNLGIEELEYDRLRGIYDYTTDSDGFGVTLHLKSGGMGILYMENGDDAAAAVVIVK